LGHQREKGTEQFFPNGGERKGRAHARLAAGGATLVMEGHSDGSAGPLSYIIVVWWDKHAKLYGYFTCFKDPDVGCEVRGTAHLRWGQVRERLRRGCGRQEMKFRDTFQDIKPNSHTLVFVWVKDDGSTQPVIITKGGAALLKPGTRTAFEKRASATMPLGL
jgi:hypothetical protein